MSHKELVVDCRSPKVSDCVESSRTSTNSHLDVESDAYNEGHGTECPSEDELVLTESGCVAMPSPMTQRRRRRTDRSKSESPIKKPILEQNGLSSPEKEGGALLDNDSSSFDSIWMLLKACEILDSQESSKQINGEARMCSPIKNQKHFPNMSPSKTKGEKSSNNGPCTNPNCAQPDVSPQWRKGPPECPILCNACGTRWLRNKSLVPIVVSFDMTEMDAMYGFNGIDFMNAAKERDSI